MRECRRAALPWMELMQAFPALHEGFSQDRQRLQASFLARELSAGHRRMLERRYGALAS